MKVYIVVKVRDIKLGIYTAWYEYHDIVTVTTDREAALAVEKEIDAMDGYTGIVEIMEVG